MSDLGCSEVTGMHEEENNLLYNKAVHIIVFAALHRAFRVEALTEDAQTYFVLGSRKNLVFSKHVLCDST